MTARTRQQGLQRWLWLVLGGCARPQAPIRRLEHAANRLDQWQWRLSLNCQLGAGPINGRRLGLSVTERRHPTSLHHETPTGNRESRLQAMLYKPLHHPVS
jgi:hypothetical protein